MGKATKYFKKIKKGKIIDKVDSKKTIKFTLRFDKKLYDLIETLKKDKNSTTSEIIRQLILRGIKNG